MKSSELEDRNEFKSRWVDPEKRKLNREFCDIIGLVSPQKAMDDPEIAIMALVKIRQLADFIERMTYHIDCGGLELHTDDFMVLGHLAGCIYEGAGYVVEYLERDVQPCFRDEYAECHKEGDNGN